MGEVQGQAARVVEVLPEMGAALGETALMVAIAVPLFATHRAGVRVEQATLAQLAAERQAAATRIAGEVAAAARCAGDEGEVVLLLLSRKREVLVRLKRGIRDATSDGG